MLLREYSGGDRLHLHSFEQKEVHFKEHVSAVRLFGYTFVKRNPFLAIIWGFVHAKGWGVYFTTEINSGLSLLMRSCKHPALLRFLMCFGGEGFGVLSQQENNTTTNNVWGANRGGSTLQPTLIGVIHYPCSITVCVWAGELRRRCAVFSISQTEHIIFGARENSLNPPHSLSFPLLPPHTHVPFSQ